MRPSIQPMMAATLLVLATAAAAQDAVETKPGALVTLRGVVRDADRINDVLREFAEPATAQVTPPETPAAWLAARCGSIAGNVSETLPQDDGSLRFRYTPCLRFAPARTVTAPRAAPLDALIARYQLFTFRASALKVIPGSKGHAPAGEVRAGDQVAVPPTPLWTDLQLKAGREVGAFAHAIAAALGCRANEAIACFARHDLSFFERPAFRPIPPPATAPDEDARPQTEPGEAAPDHKPGGAAARRDGWFRFAAASADPRPATPAPAAAPEPVWYGEVVPDQWPYDKARLAKLLAPARVGVVVGVADGALGGSDGSPIDQDVFDQNQDPGSLGPDGKRYDNDIFGAGLKAVDSTDKTLLGTGNLALCTRLPKPDYTQWGSNYQFASHGSIVSSLATGLPLWRSLGDGQARTGLPHLVFFRLYRPESCDAASLINPEALDVLNAIGYLVSRRASVVNLSGDFAIGDHDTFASSMSGPMSIEGTMMTVSAGNGEIGDIDKLPACPFCLALDPNFGRRVLVIGAADRNLRISAYSNFGPARVRFYAPGTAGDAVDIDNNPPVGQLRGTSFAAPRVALDLAVLKSFGLPSYEARERLMEASWPLVRTEGVTDSDGAWVVDLTKVAAVMTDAVELLEPADANGDRRRRTYIGEIQGAKQGVRLCGNISRFVLGRVRAVRLYDPEKGKPDGTRAGFRFTNQFIKVTQDYKREPILACDPGEEIVIHDVVVGKMHVPAAAVTLLMFRAR